MSNLAALLLRDEMPTLYLVFWERTTCNANPRHKNYLPPANVMLLLLLMFCVWDVCVCVFFSFLCIALACDFSVCVRFLVFSYRPGGAAVNASGRLFTPLQSHTVAPRGAFTRNTTVSLKGDAKANQENHQNTSVRLYCKYQILVWRYSPRRCTARVQV